MRRRDPSVQLPLIPLRKDFHVLHIGYIDTGKVVNGWGYIDQEIIAFGRGHPV